MIPILFQDQDIVIIQKPAGIPSQMTLDPKRPNLPSLLKSQLGQEVYLHHRLDKDTSGIMVFGLSKRANPGLTTLFREHRIQKTYLCISKINQPIENQNFTVHNFLAPVRGQGKKLMRMVSVRKGGWEAITDLSVLQSQEGFAYIQAKPKTGRTHQIRIHLAEKKLPILGDPLYGGKSSLVPRLMLHATALQFSHPITNQQMNMTCPPPTDFQKILENLKLT